MAFSRGSSRPGFGPFPRVNLLPRSEIERRERAALMGRWLLGVVLALILVAAVSAGAYAVSMFAGHRLAAENARTTQLIAQLAGLSEVSKIRGVQRELEDFRTEAMGADVAWMPVFSTIEGVIPGAGTITGWDLTTGALPGESEATATPGVTGTVTLESRVPMDLVSMVRELRRQDGVIDADGALLEREATDILYRYTLTATFDQTVYTGRYARKEK